MSLSIACHVPGQGSCILADSLTKRGDEVSRDSAKSFRLDPCGAALFASGRFADLPGLVAGRRERSFGAAAGALWRDLAAADLNAPDAPTQLLMVSASRLLLRVPGFALDTDGPAIAAAGNWVQWALQFWGTPVTTDLRRLPAAGVPSTLGACRDLMSSLAGRALAMWQTEAGYPLYETTLTPDEEVTEVRIDDPRAR